MLVYPPAKFRKRRGQSKRTTPPAPITGNRILTVVPGPGGNEMTLTVDGTITNVADWPMAFEVFVEDTWYWVMNGDYSTPGTVILTFEYDVSTASLWNVPVPGVWQFADEEPLEPPTSGTIG